MKTVRNKIFNNFFESIKLSFIYLANDCQLIVTPSKITEPLKISKIITKKTAKRAPNTPIKTVVPQPGATLPDSEFNGRSKVPKAILKINSVKPYIVFIT